MKIQVERRKEILDSRTSICKALYCEGCHADAFEDLLWRLKTRAASGLHENPVRMRHDGSLH